MNDAPPLNSLDPDDWDAFRAQAHCMLDDMLNHLQGLRDLPVWQPIPDKLRQRYRAPLPHAPSNLDTLHRRFMDEVLPHGVGNTHPGFMGWVHGGGTPVGMLAEMLSAGLNANLGGRDQMPMEVEKQVLHWVRELFDFPESAHGLFVTGASMANFIAILVARTAALGEGVRRTGLASLPRLVAYTSVDVHGCIPRAMEMAGLGSDALRRLPVNAAHQLDIAALTAAITADRGAGLAPFLLVATAGTVNTGAIDDLTALARLARQEKLWLHVDGALGALGKLSPELSPRLAGIEQADSVAFDFHKWGQAPYDAGYILVRDGEIQRRTFAAPAAYLQRAEQGLAAGSPWPCDYGPDLSRSFRALKVWFTLQHYGTERLGRMMAHTCELSAYLAQRINIEPRLELLAPVALNIACFRYRFPGADEAMQNHLNAKLVIALQEGGRVAPSSTTLDGKLAIRAAIVNHRTNKRNIDTLIEETLERAATIM